MAVPAPAPHQAPNVDVGTVLKQTSRRDASGAGPRTGSLGADTHANSNLFPLPSGAMRNQSAHPSFERLDRADAFQDRIALGFVALFFGSVAVGLFAIYLLVSRL
jgi:hypothetical protein